MFPVGVSNNAVEVHDDPMMSCISMSGKRSGCKPEKVRIGAARIQKTSRMESTQMQKKSSVGPGPARMKKNERNIQSLNTTLSIFWYTSTYMQRQADGRMLALGHTSNDAT